MNEEVPTKDAFLRYNGRQKVDPVDNQRTIDYAGVELGLQAEAHQLKLFPTVVP